MKWILLVILISGCSSLDSSRKLDTGCDLTCKSCGEVKLKCNQDWDIIQDTQTQGTISGPSIGD